MKVEVKYHQAFPLSGLWFEGDFFSLQSSFNNYACYGAVLLKVKARNA